MEGPAAATQTCPPRPVSERRQGFPSTLGVYSGEPKEAGLPMPSTMGPYPARAVVGFLSRALPAQGEAAGGCPTLQSSALSTSHSL